METRFSMVPLAALKDRRLTYRQLVVLGVICSFRQASNNLSVCAGRDEIAERCGLHPSVISSATTDLEDFGWLQKSGRGGRSMKTTYLITIPETVAESETVTGLDTVAESETVTGLDTVAESETVTEPVSKTVAEYATRQYRTEKSTDIRAVKAVSADPEGFAECWSAYPKRLGPNNRSEALKAYQARIKAGISHADILAGVKRYAAYCQSEEIAGTRFVKQAKTFFGPENHFADTWSAAADAATNDSGTPDFMAAAMRTNKEAAHVD